MYVEGCRHACGAVLRVATGGPSSQVWPAMLSVPGEGLADLPSPSVGTAIGSCLVSWLSTCQSVAGLSVSAWMSMLSCMAALDSLVVHVCRLPLSVYVPVRYRARDG